MISAFRPDVAHDHNVIDLSEYSDFAPAARCCCSESALTVPLGPGIVEIICETGRWHAGAAGPRTLRESTMRWGFL